MVGKHSQREGRLVEGRTKVRVACDDASDACRFCGVPKKHAVFGGDLLSTIRAVNVKSCCRSRCCCASCFRDQTIPQRDPIGRPILSWRTYLEAGWRCGHTPTGPSIPAAILPVPICSSALTLPEDCLTACLARKGRNFHWQ